MYKMVFYSLLLTVLAMGFIVTKSDGLRRAAQTGDMAFLTQSTPISLPSLTGGLGVTPLATGRRRRGMSNTIRENFGGTGRKGRS